MIPPLLVQHDHARVHDAWRPVPARRLLSPTPASVAAAFLAAAVLMEAPEQMFVKAQSRDTRGLCDTSGTVVGGVVEGSCSVDRPVLCCNGEKCIERSWINNGRDSCGDGSDETAVPFSQCAAEREASPIETRTAVAVTCKPRCGSYDEDYCQEATLTEVPTFVNKDVTEM